MRLGKPRFSEDTFRFVKLRVTEAYRDRVRRNKSWCDERRMLDLQINCNTGYMLSSTRHQFRC